MKKKAVAALLAAGLSLNLCGCSAYGVAMKMMQDYEPEQSQDWAVEAQLPEEEEILESEESEETGNEDAEVERQYIQELLAYKTEGLIILSHTLSSKELSEYHIPIVTIEREDEYVCSVNTDNYMGGMQAATILAKSGCDILIHANADFPSNIPAYGRIQGFQDFCKANGFEHRILIRDFGDSFEENNVEIAKLLQEIEEAYSEKKVGIFMPNDTHANILLNCMIRKYGMLPERYKIVGFDNSPVSREAVIPITTVGQQIDKIAQEAVELLSQQINERKKRRPKPLSAPIHKVFTPVLIRRETTK